MTGNDSGKNRPTQVVAARPQLMRAMNEQLMLEQVRLAGPVSRTDLARASGLSKPTVAVALANLERDGLVRVAGHRTGVRGPAAVLYEIRPEAGFVLGLDVGREYLRGALADLSGAVRARASRRVHAPSAHSRVSEMVSLADGMATTAGIRRSRVTQVVVGSPGVYDPERGALTMARNLPGWERPDVVHELRQVFGKSTVLENDVDLAALAERDHGHGRGIATFCFVSVGTGIGMGLVIDGRLHRGAHGAAGEISYLPIGAPAGVSSAEVRKHGQLEVVTSAAAVVRSARRHGLSGSLSARRVFAAATEGDERAIAVVAEEAELVARAIGSIVAVVDPELVVLGGGIGQAPGFASAVAQGLEALAPFVPEIRVSALGDDAVVDGGLAAGMEMAWQRILQRS
ncbi:MAG: ROK family protein [Acidimicrobiales bacterium]